MNQDLHVSVVLIQILNKTVWEVTKLTVSIYQKNTELHVFESAIDLLSFITLEMMKNNEYKKSNYLSLSGVGDSESFLPISLCGYLDRYPRIKKFILHLDNDNAGNSATDNIIHCCDGIYETEDQHPLNYKDVNEELINLMKENE